MAQVLVIHGETNSTIAIYSTDIKKEKNMNTGIKSLAILAVGAVLGSAATWYYLKDKYEKRANEEIESVKEMLLKKQNEERQNGIDQMEMASKMLKEANRINEAKENKKKADDIIATHYYSYSNTENDDDDEEVNPVKGRVKPYVISPDEFGELDEHETAELTYYADGYLLDEDDEIIEDVAGMVGEDFASHFGEYEDDSVHVRNEYLLMDYEILRDERTLHEMIAERRAAAAQEDDE